MSDNKDEIKKENQNKVEENSKDEDHLTEAKENLEDNIEDKLNDLNDKYLRLLAENQNLRKNHEQEKEDILKYGSFSFAQQILGLTDNLDRAFQIFKNDEKFKTDEFKNILSGIEMIEKELQSTLEKSSIKYIDCLDKPFDPNLHQAIGEKESDKSPGTVVEEMQKGYQMHDRLLRPSMVYVSKKSDK
ncbi:MAG: nucleotide exchange factor GrpE [Pelagibacteraceae bacterium]|nr:nucleotide exchange factor GrpE [Pelagibacteraceae bacterium]OUV88517.1 MAG: nucleotide exchange factor GrpE [Pelagibacteraceae bacterium TMED146]RZO93260.1 MAG: nucleotide exchange factor GrpE [alpha proteobacterium HIMB114]